MGWYSETFNESEMARSSECTGECVPKVLDTADIVRDAIYRQLRVSAYQLVVRITSSSPTIRELVAINAFTRAYAVSLCKPSIRAVAGH